MTTSGTGPPAPGWYPDPAGEKAWRWWDGYAWTGFASDPSGPGTGLPDRGPGIPAPGAPGTPASPSASYASYAPAAPTGALLAAEQRSAAGARWAFFFYPLVVVLTLVSYESNAAQFRSLRRQIDSGFTTQPTTYSSSPLQFVAVASLVAVLVLAMLWQYRAATAARSMGLPARLGAGLGTAGWIIPIVNLWFPYLALRDCLPPGHASRAVVVRMWVLWLVTQVVSEGALVLFVLWSPARFPVGVIAVVASIGFAQYGMQVVQAIGDAHRQLASASG